MSRLWTLKTYMDKTKMIKKIHQFLYIICIFLGINAYGNEFSLTIPIQQMTVIPTAIYSQMNINSPPLQELKFRESISVQNMVISAEEPWWKIKLKTGDEGYLRVQDAASFFDIPKEDDAYFNPYLMGITNVAELILLNDEIGASPKIALRYINKGIEHNYASAYWLKAIALRDGLGMEADINEAINNFFRAQFNEPRSFFDLALIFASDKYGRRNINEAIRLSQNGAKLGDSRAKDWLASIDAQFIEEQNHPAQLILNDMITKAEAGDTEAMRLVAAYYRTGRGTKIDALESEKWLNMAANQGNIEAMIDLGSLYYIGLDDLLPNSEMANYWFKKAAQAAHPKGEYLYGNALYYGLGIEKNEEEGLFWLNMAAKSGYQQAYFDLQTLGQTPEKKLENTQED